LWVNVLLDRYVDFERIFSGHYALDPDIRHTQTIGNLDITLNNSPRPTRSSKTIRTHSDWLLAFETAKEAILFAYPHRAKELNSYRKFIIGQFAAFGSDSNLHFHVVNLDRAIRLCVAQTNDIAFTSYNQFGDLITHHIVIRRTPDANHQPTPGGSKRSKTNPSSNKVCKQWNLGRCMSDSCKYKHGCAICGQPHQAKSCGVFKSSEGSK